MSIEGLQRNKSLDLQVQEDTTVILETNRIPDPYRFVVRDGQLWSEAYHCFVREKIARTNHIGELEYQAFSFIERWVNQNDQGVVVWVSPPAPGFYPVSKIVISEIEANDSDKRLFNRAILFDFDGGQCLKFAQDLVNYSQNRPLLDHLDVVRTTPLILNTHRISWIHILEELIDDPHLWQMVKRGEDHRIKAETLIQVRTVYQQLYDHSLPAEDARMMILGMKGNKPESCPPVYKSATAFQVFSENSLTFTGSLSKDPDFCKVCPACKKEINCVVRIGGNCPQCRALKRCG